MNRQIIDEKTGIGYTLHDNYYLPNFALPTEKEQSIGVWGQRHRRYLQKHHRIWYYNLVTTCKLNSQLADLDRQAVAILLSWSNRWQSKRHQNKSSDASHI